jgi:hypothetical protein
MNKFSVAMTTNDTQTANGMAAHSTTNNACLDFFSVAGSARKMSEPELWELFQKSFGANPVSAFRNLFYTRDVTDGQGERETFRKLLKRISFDDRMNANFRNNVQHIPTFGRWDDLFALFNTPLEQDALKTIAKGLFAENGLCGKWMPRKGPNALKIMNFLEMSPKNYRKLIVSLSQTVEQKMCSKKWEEINYSHVPSKASVRYQKAFGRNDTVRYVQYLQDLKSNKQSVKINAKAIHPHEILKGTNFEIVEQQWKSLPDFMENSKGGRILPICDVSGSMYGLPMDVCLALGIYLSERNKGPFKDLVISFCGRPKFFDLSNLSLDTKITSLRKMEWEMNTNLEAVFKLILKKAVEGNLSNDDMPDKLLILSDMQFDECVQNASQNAMEMIKEMYRSSGYKVPSVVFWNLKASVGKLTSPVKHNEIGAALVSGFSPSIMKSVLSGNLEQFDPMNIFHETVTNNPRYQVIQA